MASRIYGHAQIEIRARRIGPGEPTYVIAEAGSNHNRDLDTALQLIDVAADAGADAVKFQTYTAEGLYSRFTPTMSYLDEGGLVREQETVWELIKRIEMPWEWHSTLAEKAADREIHFMSTPFEEAAVDALEAVDVPAYKIASYEITHLPLIKRCSATRKPILISTGMASLGDIEAALDAANGAGADEILLLHCVVNYPPRFEDLNLKAIQTLASAFNVPVGWSDHTLGHTADVVAVAMGAAVIEKHFTMSRDQRGPDHGFALEPQELKEMVAAIREAEASLGSTIKRVTQAEQELFELGRRSVVLERDVEEGATLTIDDLAIKRPGSGIHPGLLELVIGRESARRLRADEILNWEDLH